MGNRWSENDKIIPGYKFLEQKPDGSLVWVPSVGKSIDFFIGRTENEDEDGGITKYIQTSKLYNISLNLPDTDEIKKDCKEIDKRSIVNSAIEYLMTKTDFLCDLEKLCDDDSNLIGANSGQCWGDEPVRCLGTTLEDEGYRLIAEPPVYPKIGGRNRYQTYGVLISRKKGRAKPNYESKSTTYPFFWYRFDSASASH